MLKAMVAPTRALGLAVVELEPDILPHLLDDELPGHLVPELRVEAEPGDQGVEAGPAQDLLADRAEAHLQRARDGGPDELLGHLLAVDQDERPRLEDARHR